VVAAASEVSTAARRVRSSALVAQLRVHHGAQASRSSAMRRSRMSRSSAWSRPRGARSRLLAERLQLAAQLAGEVGQPGEVACIASKLRSASPCACRCFSTPAASSMNPRRSSGRDDRIASS